MQTADGSKENLMMRNQIVKISSLLHLLGGLPILAQQKWSQLNEGGTNSVFRLKTMCLVIVLTACGSLSQTAISQTDQERIENPGPSPVAFVYVKSGTSKVYGFAAAANGALQAVPGSPFNYAVYPEAISGKYLFGVESNGTTIDSYLIEPSGALQHAASLNTETYDPDACDYLGVIHVDHTGQNLYNVITEPDCTYDLIGAVQSFKINGSTGELGYLGTSSADSGLGGVDVFLGNDKFAYASDFFGFDHESDCGIDIYRRPSNGDLDNLGYVDMETLSPPTNDVTTYYCAEALATDPTNHIATLMQQSDGEGGFYGKPQIGVYTADALGNLSTTSTYQNMPVAKTDPDSIRMSPSGKLLAVGGATGLEIFHFNGANPATEFEVLLPNKSISDVYWDTSNHLYAAVGTNKLYVYTITPTSITQAPGSPYTVPGLGSMIVDSK
jgi:hypothetical protein